MQHINPYAASTTSNISPSSKTRLGIVPATIVAFSGIVVFVIAVLHFADVMTAEIGRAVSGGQLAHAIGCVLATSSLIACAAMLLFASREWLRHNVGNGLLFTFVGPPALVFLAFFFMYSFG